MNDAVNSSFSGVSKLPQAVVYTRQGCHLCEQAEQLLLRHGLRVQLVDIDADPQLAHYDQCVPVVWIDGQERFRGRVSEVLLRRLLRGLSGAAEGPTMRELGIFAKHWTPGQVKTRLAAAIGPAAAANVARVFLTTLTCRLGAAADRRSIGFSPPSMRAAFAELAGRAWQLRPQTEGPLGRRMQDFFAAAQRTGAQRVVLLGADAPTIPVAYVDAAFAALEQARLVLGPSEDGGYYLIGVQEADLPVFDDGIPWGTAEVLAATRQRAAAAGIRIELLPKWYDVDELADLRRLHSELVRLRSQWDSCAADVPVGELAVIDDLAAAVRQGLQSAPAAPPVSDR